MKKARRFLVAVMIIVTAVTFIACNKIGNANFKVSFEVDGKAYYEISTKGEEELKMPDDPTKENYATNSERGFRKTQQKISNNIENSLQMIA